MKVFIATLLIVAIGMALLSIRLFFGKRFVKTHVSQRTAMRQRGIGCVQSQDAMARMENPHKIKERIKKTDAIQI